jgi:ADP-heptose:LPS heptosyltransferase
MQKLILRNFQSPGDILMLTATVRDLHACYPGRFQTDVRTPFPDLWLHNPHITPLSDDEPGVKVIDCHYPLIDRINSVPYHFLHGFTEHLNDVLGLQVKPTQFKGDVHLSREEKEWLATVEDALGRAPRYWLFASGGKNDYTIKWWSPRRYQEVVDHFLGRIDFVQVGDAAHHHPPLERVIDLRGQTTIRQLVRLMHHADGAISAVSLLMHLAAAVETREDMPRNRPCVVVAGGREPPHFTAYPHHQYLHTVGALRCCADGGCWKSRTRPLGDGDPKDDELCTDVAGELPRCMDMIGADDVIRAVERYYQGGALRGPQIQCDDDQDEVRRIA